MVDTPAPTNPQQMPPAEPEQRLSSQEYLQQLRARRTSRQNQPAPEPQPNINQEPKFQPEQVPPEPQYQAAAEQQPQPVNESFAESEIFPGQVKPLPEETVLEWQAASRPFKKRNKQFYTTVGLITLLISLILFFAGQFLPIAVVVAVAFLAYVLSSVPPELLTNKITTFGIHNDKAFYYWDELGRFWFEERYQQKMVVIETARFPGRISLLLNKVSENEMEQILSEVLLKQKPADTFMDKSATWIQEKIPLDIG